MYLTHNSRIFKLNNNLLVFFLNAVSTLHIVSPWFTVQYLLLKLLHANNTLANTRRESSLFCLVYLERTSYKCTSQQCYYPILEKKTEGEMEKIRNLYKEQLKAASMKLNPPLGLALLASGLASSFSGLASSASGLASSAS